MLLIPENDKQCNEMLNNSHVEYMYFSGAWCGPCKKIGPIFESILGSKIGIKIDVDNCPELSERYGIQSLPTFVRIKDNKKLIGASVDKLKELLD